MIECSSEDGITIGLIDTIMTAAAALKDRDMDHPEIKEALMDLKNNEPLKILLS